MKDAEFDDLLRLARDKVPLPGSFRQGVWHRIESASLDSRPQFRWLNSFIDVFQRPLGAAVGFAATVTLGLWLGSATVSYSKDTKTAYVESVSPFAQAHRK